jgi:hypothetical protein
VARDRLKRPQPRQKRSVEFHGSTVRLTITHVNINVVI